MTDPTAELFESLKRRRHAPTLKEARGTVRFDLEHDHSYDHWLVAVESGNISVSQGMRDADCVVETDKGLFDRVAAGQENTISALARGAIRVNGRIELLVLLERLLPGPAGAHDPRQARGERRRS
jgi:putative sterol carrier protein